MPDLTINQLAGVAPEPNAFQMKSDDVGNRDTFLKLLTTQMQNQDPTSPMDNQEFLSQLAQFSSLEQLMGMQSSLEAVYSGISAMNNTSMANLLGTEVTARGDTVHMDGENPVELGWDHEGGVSGATMHITDDSGKVVRTVQLGSIDGEGTWTWDGTDKDGNLLPEGDYSFKISGTDAEGNGVQIETHIRGTITGMDYSTGQPQPSVEGVPLDLGDIITLRAGDDG